MPDHHAKFEFEKYYHIFNRGNNKEYLFKSADNYMYFLQKWKKYILPYSSTLSYCLMPNHFHFLIKINEESNLTKPQRLSKVVHDNNATEGDINILLEEQFRKLFMSYALAYNKQNNRTGAVFQKRFKRIEINSDQYLTRIIQYIHSNPIHHGFENEYAAWRFSSYNAIIGTSETSVNKQAVLTWFGGKDAFVDFHKKQIEITDIKSYVIDSTTE